MSLVKPSYQQAVFYFFFPKKCVRTFKKTNVKPENNCRGSGTHTKIT